MLLADNATGLSPRVSSQTRSNFLKLVFPTMTLNSTTLSAIFVVTLLAGLPLFVHAEVRIYDNCGDNGKKDLRDAFDFLLSVEDQLKYPPFKLSSRRLKRKRIRRNIGRKLRNGRISCRVGVICNKHQDKRIGIHPWGSWGRRTRICLAKMREEGYSFCDLVNTVAHELGHAAGIAWLHVGKRGERVYKFGNFAETLCRDAKMDRPLTRSGMLVEASGSSAEMTDVMTAERGLRGGLPDENVAYSSYDHFQEWLE